MQKKVLTEQALYFGDVSMPKGFEIDRDKLSGDILQSTFTDSEFPFSRCINYYAVNDPILNVVPAAVKALQSGFSFGSGMEQEIIFLASRTGK